MFSDPSPDRLDDLLDLRAAIAELPPSLRAVAELVYQGYTQREIARRLGINQSTVSRRILKIRVKLTDFRA